MALSAGRLRHRITIQEKITTQSQTDGSIIESWVDKWVNVPAEVAPLSTKEFIAASALHSQVTGKITLRYRDGLDASMRIVFRNRYYNITGVLPDKISGLEYITLPVTEGVNEG